MTQPAKQGVGFANIDQTDIGQALLPTGYVTSHVGYVRLHGRNYKEGFDSEQRNERHKLFLSPYRIGKLGRTSEDRQRERGENLRHHQQSSGWQSRVSGVGSKIFKFNLMGFESISADSGRPTNPF